MKKIILIFLILNILLINCKKDDVEIPFCAPNFLPMSVGNYWVYENISIDTLGNETNNEKIDSIIIQRDTILNGNTYFVFEGIYHVGNPNWQYLYSLRDSSGYIVNEKGRIFFATDDFDNILETDYYFTNPSMVDTFWTANFSMKKIPNSVTIQAGMFNNVLNFEGHFYAHNPTNGIKPNRYTKNYYVEDVGKIVESIFFSHSSFVIEKRLLRFNIEN